MTYFELIMVKPVPGHSNLLYRLRLFLKKKDIFDKGFKQIFLRSCVIHHMIHASVIVFIMRNCVTPKQSAAVLFKRVMS